MIINPLRHEIVPSPAIVCVTSEIAIIDPDDGLAPDLHQAIISTNALLLLIGPYFNR